MKLSNYYFRFSLLGTVLAILGISLFASLGTWQANRAQEKKQLQQIMDQRAQQPPMPLTHSPKVIEEVIYTPTIAQGHYDKKHEILIDNEVYKGQAGYHVLTPFILNDDQSVIMINRGWISLGRSRNILPETTAPEGEQKINGTLAKIKSKPALILNDNLNNLQQKVWPFFDYENYQKLTGFKMVPLVLLLKESEPNGYMREWPKYDAKVGMHIGYSIQWYVFALIILATYLGINFKKKVN